MLAARSDPVRIRRLDPVFHRAAVLSQSQQQWRIFFRERYSHDGRMRLHLPFRLSAVPQQWLCPTCSVRSRVKSWSRASLGGHGHQRTGKSRRALEDHGILKGKNGTCALLARRRRDQCKRQGSQPFSSKYGYTLWLSATGDDEDLFYYRVAGPRLPPFLSGASTVPTCEHAQCRACNVVAKFQCYDQQLDVDHGGATI